MKARQPLDRAALVLGVVSLASAGFMFVEGDFQLVQIRAAGLAVAVVLGLLAVVASWLDEPALLLATGASFLLAAAIQLGLLASRNVLGQGGGFLGGNASTFSLWLGLGVGLIAVGIAPRPEATEDTSKETA